MQKINLPDMYEDQMDLIQKVRQSAAKGNKSILMYSPCGSGKTRMASWLAISAINKGGCVYFDAPLKELRRQISNSFSDLGIPHSFVSSGQRYSPFDRAFVSTSGTLINKMERTVRPNVVFVDETHILGKNREDIIRYYKSKGALVVGLSASPERTDGFDMGELYDDFVEGLSPSELMNLGRLSGYRLFTPNKPDFSQLRVTDGDYNQSDLSSFMESQSYLIGDCVKHYKKLAMGKRHLTYCTSVKHSQLVCQEYKDNGISAAHIDGSMSDDERVAIVKAFARRELKVITSVDLLLAGFDMAQASGDPNAVVESMSDLRPTKSRPTQTQKVGRATRKKPDGSDAIIIDHTSNCWNADGSINHGPPDYCPPWKWQGREKKKGESVEKTVPVRQCPVCFFVHRPTPQCQACGHIYEVAGRMLETQEGELIEVTREELKGIAKQERQVQGRAQTLTDLKELEKRKGYKKGWAENVYKARMRK